MPAFQLDALIDALVDAGVEFVVIGGTAAVLHGAPVVTGDVDIVHNRTAENVARLLAVLLGVRAKARADRRNLPPTESALMGRGLVLLDTDLGPIDVLCELDPGQDYHWLKTRSDVITRGGGELRIVDLPTLIELKTKAGRLKDRLTVPILVATLEERARQRE
jgi:hypothetical protein